MASELASIASQLVNGGGILASDESPPTLGKRLIKCGLENDEPTRCAWRSCLYGAELAENGIRGCIIYEEALNQKVPEIYLEKKGKGKDDEEEEEENETSVPSLLERQSVLLGVKADAGLAPFESPAALEGDTVTRGLERLPEACARWRRQGASFTKWRSALKVHRLSGSSPGSPSFGPSPAAVAANAEQLARYAAISQAHGLVPLVEPELLIDGEHSAEDAAEALKEVLNAVFAAIDKINKEAAAAAAAAAAGKEGEGAAGGGGGVSLRGLLLKLMPCVPGGDSTDPSPPSDEHLARLTLDALRDRVPAEVPGVVLLSGGLSERRATEVLQAINEEKARRNEAGPSSLCCPWAISFSFGRALQASAMRLWSEGRLKKGDEEGGEERASVAAARAAVEASAKANKEASLGIYKGPHPTSENDAVDLREGFRGFRDDAVAREAAEKERKEAVAV